MISHAGSISPDSTAPRRPTENRNRTRVYLDNAATTPLLAEAREAMEPYFAEEFGNASSPYAVARQSRSAIDRARTQVAALIGAQADEIVWTAGGTESDNWALLGVALANLEARGHIILSRVEHHAVLEAAETLRELGFEVELAPVDDNGVAHAESIARLLRSETRLVSVMAVNNETGTIQPIEEIARVVRDFSKSHGARIVFHSDAVQAAGKVLCAVDSFGVDLLSLSAHKIGGPKGAGALYIRRGTPLRALLRGGGQERGRRAGTENVPAIVGFGTAAMIAARDAEINRAHLLHLRERLENGLREIEGAVINGGPNRAPHISNVSLRGARAESLALNLDGRGFAVGTGSACASGAIEPSHVLRAMNRDKETARSSLRISLGVQNTAEEIDEFLQTLRELLKR